MIAVGSTYRCEFIILDKYRIATLIRKLPAGWEVGFLDDHDAVINRLILPEERPELPAGVNAVNHFFPHIPEINFASSVALTICLQIGRIMDGTDSQ